MLELIGVIALIAVVLTGATLRGQLRKQTNFELIEAAPERVTRLYLRKADEVEAYWLYARLNNRKRLCLAAPWDVDAALARLAEVGVTLSSDDLALLQAHKRQAATAPTPARRRTASGVQVA
jgi:energy-converting hydrogenase A subunit M